VRKAAGKHLLPQTALAWRAGYLPADFILLRQAAFPQEIVAILLI